MFSESVMSLYRLTDVLFLFSLSVCLLQQWETFSERSSSSQTLTQFDSNIAPADPVSQSLSMHGFANNGQTLTLSGNLSVLSVHDVPSQSSLGFSLPGF